MPIEPYAPGAYKRGPGGRPTRQEAERRHQSLLATATRLFLDKGWDGASVDEISQQSGVAKRFIYARYPDKAALFVSAVERFIGEKMEILHSFESPPEDIEEGLCAFGRKLLDLALRTDALAFHRLFIAEARIPWSCEALRREQPPSRPCRDQSGAGGLCRSGRDRTQRSRNKGQQFFILIVGVPQRLALLGGREEPMKEDLRLKAAVRLFLNGCRMR